MKLFVRYVYDGEPKIMLLGLVELEHAKGMFKSD